MSTQAEIISNVYVDCGLPPQRVLPLTEVLPRVHQALRFYNAGLELAGLGQALKTLAPFLPTAKEMNAPSTLRGRAALVEIEVNAATDDWDTIETVNREDLDLYENSGIMAVAIFGEATGQKRIRFSWDPRQDTRRIRITHDQLSDNQDPLESAVNLPDYYVPMIAKRVAIRSLATCIEKQPDKAEVLLLRRDDIAEDLKAFEKLWEMRKSTRPGQGATRRAAFNRNRRSRLI